MTPAKLKKYPFWFYYAILFIGVICIGWSAIFVKMADVGGIASAFYRMLFGLLGVIPIWLFGKKSYFKSDSYKIAILSGVIFALDIAVWNISIEMSKATVSTLLANMAPVWVGIGSIVFIKESPGKLFWIGTAVSITGVSLIIGSDLLELFVFDQGHLFAILASMFYATYLLVMRKGRLGMDTVSFTAISMFSSTILLFCIALITSTPLTGYSAQSWWALAGLGLIAQLGGWLAINYALGFIPSTTASVGLLSQTIITAIIAYILLDEKLIGIEIVGAIVVLFGIFLVTRLDVGKTSTID